MDGLDRFHQVASLFGGSLPFPVSVHNSRFDETNPTNYITLECSKYRIFRLTCISNFRSCSDFSTSQTVFPTDQSSHITMKSILPGLHFYCLIRKFRENPPLPAFSKS